MACGASLSLTTPPTTCGAAARGAARCRRTGTPGLASARSGRCGMWMGGRVGGAAAAAASTSTAGGGGTAAALTSRRAAAAAIVSAKGSDDARRRRRPHRAAAVTRASSTNQADVAVGADADDVVASNSDVFRAAPLAVGGGAVLALLVNRIFSHVAPVADASSSQSRADVLCLAMAGCLVLTDTTGATTPLLAGLTWVALKPKPPNTVVLRGVDVGAGFVDPALPPAAAEELRWCWSALNSSTACGAVAVFYRGRRAMQAGVVPKRALNSGGGDGGDGGGGGLTAEDAPPLGDICNGCMASGSGNYLANLILFPGRVEFAPFLPDNAQAVAGLHKFNPVDPLYRYTVVVQPTGGEGVIVAASGTQRGFTPADQAWIAVVAEKLDQTLSGEERA